MDDLVKRSIEGRKTAIFNAYDIKDQNINEKIDDLFKRISALGEACKDVNDFETKFVSSSLNQEYIDLFTKIATTFEQKNLEENLDLNEKSTKEEIKDEVVSEIKYQVDSATQPIRRKANQEAYDKVRDIPVVGDVLNIKQHVDLLNKFKRKKNE